MKPFIHPLVSLVTLVYSHFNTVALIPLFCHHAWYTSSWLTYWLTDGVTWRVPLSLCQAHLSLHAQSPLPVVPATSHPCAGELTAHARGKTSLYVIVVVLTSAVAFLFIAALSSRQPDAEPARVVSPAAQVQTALIQTRFKPFRQLWIFIDTHWNLSHWQFDWITLTRGQR